MAVKVVQSSLPLASLAKSAGVEVGSSTDDAQQLGIGTIHAVERKPFKENVKIGEAELVRSYSLLVPQNTVTCIAVQIRGWSFSLEIKFEKTGSEDPRVQFARERDDAAKLTLLNWDSPLGISLSTPLEIAYLTDESKILLLASNQAIGGMNKLELQMLLQEKP